MNKEIAQYINELLADRERLLDERKDDVDYEKQYGLKEATESELANIYQAQKEYNLIYNDLEARSNVDAERMVVWVQELSWERSIIYRCQKAMDYFEEEN